MIGKLKERRHKKGISKKMQLTDNERKDVIDSFLAGSKVSDIAIKYNRTKEGIYKILRKNNII